MDDDDVRRGRPTVHRAYGVDVATAAGLAMVPLAARSAYHAAQALGLSAPECGDVVRTLMQASGGGGMIGGQLLDLDAEGVHLTLDAKGARVFRDITRENVGKRMAIILFEKGRGEVVTAPVIRTEIGGGRVQISGSMSTVESSDTALLLRAGSLAAPMEIVEERTIGPSLGAENIERGFNSVIWGFAVIVVFMVIYYLLFGVFSSVALAFNLVLLVAVLSMLQATLTLPGIAAMALALGMAIDSNVLINERIREELRRGAAPQTAIQNGYETAWATILDSNVTTLIAGIALLLFGSGPVRGFAVVHCIGILTSMFSSVFFSRGLVNMWYGRQRKLKTLSIGTVWKPDTGSAVSTKTS
jgi:preprotein translocase subunit SecD